MVIAQVPEGLNHVVSDGIMFFELLAREGVEIVASEIRFGEFCEVFGGVVHRVMDAL